MNFVHGRSLYDFGKNFDKEKYEDGNHDRLDNFGTAFFEEADAYVIACYRKCSGCKPRV